MNYKISIYLAILIFLSTIAFATDTNSWKNVCPDPDICYCKNVGKTAYNAFGPEAAKHVKLGKIIGVAWRPKGSVIGYSTPPPEAGLPRKTHLSPRDAYYYIIDELVAGCLKGKMPPPFLRQSREINAK